MYIQSFIIDGKKIRFAFSRFRPRRFDATFAPISLDTILTCRASTFSIDFDFST
jgi:hypothetical protein